MEDMMENGAYMDYQSGSPVDPRVIEAMLPYMSRDFGNPSSMHKWGNKSKQALAYSREMVAQMLGANPDCIIFTSSATESNNLALKGASHRFSKKGKHIITSNIEHWSVHTPLKALQKEGFEVSQICVDEKGLVNSEELASTLREDTILVSVMAANNEIGTIQPLEELAKIAHNAGVLFHTDATCAIGKMPLDVEKMGLDIVTISSNDIYGPRGVAALYVRGGIRLEPVIHGGGQEYGMRSGTENISGIVGFGKASEIMHMGMDAETRRLKCLGDRLMDGVLKIPGASLNGCRKTRLPNIVNARFSFVEGEALVLGLDAFGVAASSGSACSSKTLEPSHVLLAIGLPHEVAHGSVQFSIGRWTAEDDVDRAIDALGEVVERLQRMSPLTPAGWMEREYGDEKR